MKIKIKDKNLYYVGGFVRDELIGIPSFDVDFCYEGDAIEFSKEFNVVKVNPDFGTVRINLDGDSVDIASTRTEYYPRPGHLPVVNQIGCSLKEDLARRDFTINALAKNTLNSEIVDFFNGLSDIKNRIIRVLHKDSFIEDPTRIIRALKFSVRLGFELDCFTKDLQNAYLENINYDMCYHRIKKELKETFNLNNFKAYLRFCEQGIYKLLSRDDVPHSINPKIVGLIENVKPEEIWLVYLGCYNLSSLELNRKEQNIVDTYNSIKEIAPTNDYELYKMFSCVPFESVLLYAANVDYELAEHYLLNLANIRLTITGDDLKSLGVLPGKKYKEIFDFLLEERIKGQALTKEDELALVKERYL